MVALSLWCAAPPSVAARASRFLNHCPRSAEKFRVVTGANSVPRNRTSDTAGVYGVMVDGTHTSRGCGTSSVAWCSSFVTNTGVTFTNRGVPRAGVTR
jgi:hypothetical protein